jgi:hypothetical protein
MPEPLKGGVMADPLMLSVASAVAGKAAETATEAGKTALAALVRLVRGRLAGHETAAGALDGARSAPEDPAAIGRLALALQQVATADHEFAAQIRALCQEVHAELSVREDRVVNNSTGTVAGHLIQARDLHIQGSLQLGDVRNQPPP